MEALVGPRELFDMVIQYGIVQGASVLCRCVPCPSFRFHVPYLTYRVRYLFAADSHRAQMECTALVFRGGLDL